MEPYKIFGSIAMLASLAIVFIGLPQQIYKNYKSKSTGGLASILFIMACITYTFWSLHGWFYEPDINWFLVIAQTPGSVLAFILLIQMIKYRSKIKTSREVSEILDFLYPGNQFFVSGFKWESAKYCQASFGCNVPKSSIYTKIPIPYVSAEQYIRCISQISYVYIGQLIKSGKITEVNFSKFLTLMKNYKLWFRITNVKYCKEISKGQDFNLSVNLKEILTRNKLFICSLNINGPIVADIQFVASV